MIKPALILITAISLTGCQTYTGGGYGAQRPATMAEKQAVLTAMRQNYFDPYSIQDAEISNVWSGIKADGSEDRFVCVQANGKNRLGAYTGKKATVYKINSQTVVTDTDTDETESNTSNVCSRQKVSYQPFPEAMRIAGR